MKIDVKRKMEQDPDLKKLSLEAIEIIVENLFDFLEKSQDNYTVGDRDFNEWAEQNIDRVLIKTGYDPDVLKITFGALYLINPNVPMDKLFYEDFSVFIAIFQRRVLYIGRNSSNVKLGVTSKLDEFFDELQAYHYDMMRRSDKTSIKLSSPGQTFSYPMLAPGRDPIESEGREVFNNFITVIENAVSNEHELNWQEVTEYFVNNRSRVYRCCNHPHNMRLNLLLYRALTKYVSKAHTPLLNRILSDVEKFVVENLSFHWKINDRIKKRIKQEFSRIMRSDALNVYHYKFDMRKIINLQISHLDSRVNILNYIKQELSRNEDFKQAGKNYWNKKLDQYQNGYIEEIRNFVMLTYVKFVYYYAKSPDFLMKLYAEIIVHYFKNKKVPLEGPMDPSDEQLELLEQLQETNPRLSKIFKFLEIIKITEEELQRDTVENLTGIYISERENSSKNDLWKNRIDFGEFILFSKLFIKICQVAQIPPYHNDLFEHMVKLKVGIPLSTSLLAGIFERIQCEEPFSAHVMCNIINMVNDCGFEELTYLCDSLLLMAKCVTRKREYGWEEFKTVTMGPETRKTIKNIKIAWMFYLKPATHVYPNGTIKRVTLSRNVANNCFCFKIILYKVYTSMNFGDNNVAITDYLINIIRNNDGIDYQTLAREMINKEFRNDSDIQEFENQQGQSFPVAEEVLTEFGINII